MGHLSDQDGTTTPYAQLYLPTQEDALPCYCQNRYVTQIKVRQFSAPEKTKAVSQLRQRRPSHLLSDAATGTVDASMTLSSAEPVRELQAKCARCCGAVLHGAATTPNEAVNDDSVASVIDKPLQTQFIVNYPIEL